MKKGITVTRSYYDFIDTTRTFDGGGFNKTEKCMIELNCNDIDSNEMVCLSKGYDNKICIPRKDLGAFVTMMKIFLQECMDD